MGAAKRNHGNIRRAACPVLAGRCCGVVLGDPHHHDAVVVHVAQVHLLRSLGQVDLRKLRESVRKLGVFKLKQS